MFAEGIVCPRVSIEWNRVEMAVVQQRLVRLPWNPYEEVRLRRVGHDTLDID